MLLRRHKATLQKKISSPADITPQGGFSDEQNAESLPFTDDSTDESKSDKHYTKTDINKLSTAELQQLAAAEGIENALETSGQDLKRILIDHYGLG